LILFAPQNFRQLALVLVFCAACGGRIFEFADFTFERVEPFDDFF
jgi:hypothetical protein